jgi:hypothetical protein
MLSWYVADAAVLTKGFPFIDTSGTDVPQSAGCQKSTGKAPEPALPLGLIVPRTYIPGGRTPCKGLPSIFSHGYIQGSAQDHIKIKSGTCAELGYFHPSLPPFCQHEAPHSADLLNVPDVTQQFFPRPLSAKQICHHQTPLELEAGAPTRLLLFQEPQPQGLSLG